MRERFTAEMYVAYYAKERGIAVEDIGVAETVVLSWGRRVIRSMAAKVGARRNRYWFYDEGHAVYPMYTGTWNGRRVSFVQCPEGAPATVMMMEELVACGARRIIGLGWAGSLHPQIPVGTLILPRHCVSEEGTSCHYPTDEGAFAPDEELIVDIERAALSTGLRAVSGRIWTTDAPYRELCESIERHRTQGIIGVDMETSAMYAFGRYRRVAVANVLVVSDEVWGEWRPAFRSPTVLQATIDAETVVLRCLESSGCS